MKVHCKTNLDDYHMEEWHTDMVARPINGDCVKSQSGKSLVVCCVTHRQPRGRAASAVDYYPGEPYLEVELTKSSTFHA